jgi:uncharacterized Ntn-hydrolase superfamily protein
MRVVITTLLFLGVAAPAFATFSIVAFDPATGDLGVAVASKVFAVGNGVPWAEAGVGAVATQADTNVGYGPRALQLLKQGLSAQQVIARLLEEDTFPGKAGRQIAVVDAKGNIAVHTGEDTLPHRGHLQGANFAVQGNILANAEVLEAMARAFQQTQGELAERLYAALKAGESAGGDSRGRQSAAILVVRKDWGVNHNNDRFVFVQVQDHIDPLIERGRLLRLQLGWSYAAKRLQFALAGKFREALEAAEKEAHYNPAGITPRTPIHRAILRLLAGDKPGAIELIGQVRQQNPKFKADWDGVMKNTPLYRSVLDDKEFMAEVMQ